jgi:hypothetical protein
MITPERSRVPETTTEINRFTEEQKFDLRENGYRIYTLTEKSLGALINSGEKINLQWREGLDRWDQPVAIEFIKSVHSEAAINPKRLFLSKGNNKDLTKQEEIVNRFSKELNKKIPGVKAIIGQVPDYAELYFQHLAKTGEYLFVAKNPKDFTRTQTLAKYDFKFMATIGLTDGIFTLRKRLTSCGDDDFMSNDVRFAHVAPLVVPQNTPALQSWNDFEYWHKIR